MCDGYNGYTNYATWCVHMWLTGADEGTYHETLALVRDCTDIEYVDMGEDLEDEVRIVDEVELEARLKSHIENRQPELVNVFGDLLGWAVRQVNWGELAEALAELETK